jgi:diacylglycerol kinase family enzyme
MYAERTVNRLTGAIRRRGAYYTVVEAPTAEQLASDARRICRLKGRGRSVPPPIAKRGKVTSIVAAGGDGTVNLAAGIALEADLPLGILPLGRFNSVARSLGKSLDIRQAVTCITKRNYRPVDVAFASGRLIVGYLAWGLVPEMARLLENKSKPRFAFRWAALGTKAAAHIKPVKMIITVDAFRFEIQPTIFNINLLPWALDLNFSPASLPDDHHAEVIFDAGGSNRDLGGYIRDLYKGQYVYGSEVRLYRGAVIKFQPAPGQQFVVDGEQVKLDGPEVGLEIGGKRLKVFCKE